MERFAEGLEGGCFIVQPLSQVANAQFRRPSRHHGRFAAGEDGDLDPGCGQHLHGCAVLNVERFDLTAVVAVDDPAIGEHTVHVEAEQPDTTSRRLQFF